MTTFLTICFWATVALLIFTSILLVVTIARLLWLTWKQVIRGE